jgi:hypothetical protein
MDARMAHRTSLLREGIVAGTVAAVVSGTPSTLHALVTGEDVLGATKAAGRILVPRSTRTIPLVAAAALSHLTISIGWGIVLSATLPRRHGWLWGALAGSGIAVLDLKVIGRRWSAIHALPFGPQLADHLAYGTTVGYVLERRVDIVNKKGRERLER